jgi:hypothetical protein
MSEQTFFCNLIENIFFELQRISLQLARFLKAKMRKWLIFNDLRCAAGRALVTP